MSTLARRRLFSYGVVVPFAVVLAFIARDGGKLLPLADHAVVIPTDRTDLAQMLHLYIEHLICELVERDL